MPKGSPVRARPGAQKLIDMKVVEGMASVGATTVDIAHFLGVSEALIRKRCDELLAKARAGMRMRLRQAQFKAAIAGNPAMLIWLGKQMLDQRERAEESSADPVATALAIREAIRLSDRAEGLAE